MTNSGIKTKKANNKYVPSKTMGFVISVVRDAKKFIDVFKNFMNEFGISYELKGRKRSVDEKKRLAKDIHRSKTKIFGYFVDKTKDVPDCWNSKNRSDAATSLLKYSVKEVVKKVDNKDCEVVIDRHEIYRDKSKKEKNYDLAEKTVKEIAVELNKNIDVVVPSSRKRTRYGDLLQTHDIVTNGVFEKVENNNRSITRILKPRIRRIKRKV